MGEDGGVGVRNYCFEFDIVGGKSANNGAGRGENVLAPFRCLVGPLLPLAWDMFSVLAEFPFVSTYSTGEMIMDGERRGCPTWLWAFVVFVMR